MRITKKEVCKFVTSIIDLLRTQNIDSLEKLDGIMGGNFPVNSSDSIDISERPSGSMFAPAMAKTITYVRPKGGLPVEIRINADKGYSIIYIKGDFILAGYEPFAKDIFGNTAQEKKFHSIYITRVKEELENIVTQSG